MAHVPRVALLRLVGEFDLSTRAQLERLFLGLAGADFAVLDMEDVTFCDSSVLTSLIRLHERLGLLAENTRLRIARPGRAVRRALQVACLDRVFAVFDSVQEALADLPQEPSVVAFLGTGMSELTAADNLAAQGW